MKTVITGLVPAIHVVPPTPAPIWKHRSVRRKCWRPWHDVDTRHKAGHDSWRVIAIGIEAA